MEVGDKLNNYGNIEFLFGDTADDLKMQLIQINIPFKIIAMYGLANKHFAWIVPSRKIKKVTKKNKE